MKILLHICCSNCAIHPFKILKTEGHNFTGFWFNPNIHPFEEHKSRFDSLRELADKWLVDMLYTGRYKPEEFFRIISPSPERCKSCYRLRLEKTAQEASKQGFDAFSTTLLISPYQDFEQLTATGRELADKYNLSFYLRDFRPYFRDSMSSAKELGLYRQKYCGCIFSREEKHKCHPE